MTQDKTSDIVARLRRKADEIDRAVARDKDDRDSGAFGEIELMREAAELLDSQRVIFDNYQSLVATAQRERDVWRARCIDLEAALW